jgi:hypothetical protein
MADTDFTKGYKAKITPDDSADMEPFNATIEYFHVDASPPGEQPAPLPPLGFWGPLPGFPTNPISGIPGLPGYEPPPPVVVIPPVPTPIPEHVPEQPEIVGGARAILTLSQDGWKWIVIPPPAFVKPPNVGIPKGDR